jgi:hypothetical protein
MVELKTLYEKNIKYIIRSAQQDKQAENKSENIAMNLGHQNL